MYEYDSYWIKSTPDTNYEKLVEDVSVDCVVIGGGITGITTAFLLQQQGLQTIIIEKGRICLGTTGHTTGKITSQHNIIYSYLIDNFGKKLAKQYADANQQAIRFIIDTVNKYNIDCDLNIEPSYIYTTDENTNILINKELVAALSLGLPAEFVDATDLPFGIKGGIRFLNQAQFHPRKYILQLANLFIENGGKIYENTQAIDIDPKKSIVTTNSNSITADNIIVATHYPFFSKGHLYFARMSPYTSYVIGIDGKTKLKKGMYISCDRDTRSFRYVQNNNDRLLLVGGQTHKTGQSDDENNNYQILMDYTNELYCDVSMQYKWSAQDYITIDKIPYIGLLNEEYNNIYVATGYGKWGMTNGTVAAMIIKDLIVDGTNPFKDIYDPSRNFTMDSVRNIFADLVNSSGEFLTSRFRMNYEKLEKIKPTQGMVLKINNKTVGIYRDENDKLYVLDTTCPHMKCKVQFNEAEKTWDCPCHGSRFNYDGTFIDGPANENLKRIESDILLNKWEK